MTDNKPRPIIRMPLKNFQHLGDLTPEKSAWWKEFGRALEAAHREWERKK
jgi:hypothetical protein